MTRTLLALPLVVAVTLAASAQKPATPYAPKDGKFSVRFPGAPKETPQTIKTGVGELSVFSATFATSDGNAYMVSYTDFPAEAARPEARDTLYDGVRDGFKGKDGKVLVEEKRDIGPDKLPGRELELEKDRQRVKVRVVLRDGRLYQVAVLGSKSFVGGKDATAFLDSFELTK